MEAAWPDASRGEGRPVAAEPCGCRCAIGLGRASSWEGSSCPLVFPSHGSCGPVDTAWPTLLPGAGGPVGGPGGARQEGWSFQATVARGGVGVITLTRGPWRQLRPTQHLGGSHLTPRPKALVRWLTSVLSGLWRPLLPPHTAGTWDPAPMGCPEPCREHAWGLPLGGGRRWTRPTKSSRTAQAMSQNQRPCSQAPRAPWEVSICPHSPCYREPRCGRRGPADPRAGRRAGHETWWSTCLP